MCINFFMFIPSAKECHLISLVEWWIERVYVLPEPVKYNEKAKETRYPLKFSTFIDCTQQRCWFFSALFIYIIIFRFCRVESFFFFSVPGVREEWRINIRSSKDTHVCTIKCTIINAAVWVPEVNRAQNDVKFPGRLRFQDEKKRKNRQRRIILSQNSDKFWWQTHV